VIGTPQFVGSRCIRFVDEDERREFSRNGEIREAEICRYISIDLNQEDGV
jgi:hypothetical protein